MRKALALALILLVATTGSAYAAGSLTIGVADGRSTYLVERIAPGDTVERHLRIGNTTPEQLAVQVYAGAATNGRGRFRWNDGHATNALTRWTTVRPARANVPSQRSVDVAVTIRVPAGARPGRHYAVVWAALPRSDTGVVNRVGTRIYVTVTQPSGSDNAVVAGVVAAVLLVLVISAIAVAARRRGSGRAGSTAASPHP